jgi:hypothetical protein
MRSLNGSIHAAQHERYREREQSGVLGDVQQQAL